MIHPDGVEKEIRKLGTAQRWRLLAGLARRYPTAVTDVLSRMKPKKDVLVIAWVLHGAEPEPATGAEAEPAAETASGAGS